MSSLSYLSHHLMNTGNFTHPLLCVSLRLREESLHFFYSRKLTLLHHLLPLHPVVKHVLHCGHSGADCDVGFFYINVPKIVCCTCAMHSPGNSLDRQEDGLSLRDSCFLSTSIFFYPSYNRGSLPDLVNWGK